MRAPFLSAQDIDRFFFRDTRRRLGRLVEQAFGYSCFLFILYCRLACPGGDEAWRWAESSAVWVLVFAPLFLMDCRNYFHYKYMRANRSRFQSQDAGRYLLIVCVEFTFKALLCLRLACEQLRPYITVRFTMFAYSIGYILHFVIGHFVPPQEGDRPEGCNVISSLLSDLGRFLSFVLVISLSLKAAEPATAGYTWQAAFWPCWGLEGVIVLVVSSLLPACLITTLLDYTRAWMTCWVMVFGAGFGVASFVSMYNVASLLDGVFCASGGHCVASSGAPHAAQCRRALDLAFSPWFALLPLFCAFTLLFRQPLAEALHEAWYQPGGRASDDAPRRRYASQPPAPPPPLMFRVTATYYSRSFEAAPGGAPPGSALAPGLSRSAFDSVALGDGVHRASRSVLDPSASILSARGATFADIVESEQLCFVCYDQTPDAVLLECGHAGLCVDCALTLAERRQGQAVCPICRSPVACVVRLRPDVQVPPHLFGHPVGSSGEAQDSAAASSEGPPADAPPQGQRWPTAAKARAIVVEVAQRPPRPSSRAWLSSLVR